MYSSKKGKGSEPQPVAEGKGMDTKDLRSWNKGTKKRVDMSLKGGADVWVDMGSVEIWECMEFL